jgi:hypothetical protein
MTWKLIKDPITGQENVVWRELENGTQESCSIYAVAYLKWVAEGNTPLPADEVTV